MDYTIVRNVPHKAQHALASGIFNKLVQDIEVYFDMTTRQKAILGVCKHHMIKISF
jgi:hypothetical protein